MTGKYLTLKKASAGHQPRVNDSDQLLVDKGRQLGFAHGTYFGC